MFGSLAEETDHRLSDVDVALLLPRDTDRAMAFDTRLQVAAALEQLCHRSVDVVILNDAPPLLRFQVIQRGRRISFSSTRRKAISTSLQGSSH